MHLHIEILMIISCPVPIVGIIDGPAVRTIFDHRVKMYLTACAKRENADQTAHPRSLIRVFPFGIYDT